MSFQWSEKQQAVIDARECSVLVSAAAGSGSESAPERRRAPDAWSCVNSA